MPAYYCNACDRTGSPCICIVPFIAAAPTACIYKTSKSGAAWSTDQPIRDEADPRVRAMEKRIANVENNYGRAIAMNEDRIDQLEEDIDSLDRRLCRLESPPKTELFNNGRVI